MMNAQITIKRGLSLFLFVFLASPGNLRAQSGWTVDDCMRYAVEQNYRVRNSRLDTRIAGEDLAAAYGDFLPSVSATGALGKRLGRSVDPKTNLYTSSSFLESTCFLLRTSSLSMKSYGASSLFPCVWLLHFEQWPPFLHVLGSRPFLQWGTAAPI